MLVEVHMGPIHFVFSAKSGCTIKKKEEERRVGDGVVYCAQLYESLKKYALRAVWNEIRNSLASIECGRFGRSM